MLRLLVFQSILATAVPAQDRTLLTYGEPGAPTARVETVSRLAPRILAELESNFPRSLVAPVGIHVHRDASTLADDVRERLHPDTPGVALLERREIHLLLDEIAVRPPNDLRTVLAHEIVHSLLHDHAGAAASHVPRWLHEGLAQVLSGETYLGAREEDLYFPAQTGQLLRWSDLREDFPDGAVHRRRAYAQSFSFVAWLDRRIGIDAILELVPRCTEEGWFAGAYGRTTGRSFLEQSDTWRVWLGGESGAGWRLLYDNCFSYLMIPCVFLLALAGIRRWNRDLAHRARLEGEGGDDSPRTPDDRSEETGLRPW